MSTTGETGAAPPRTALPLPVEETIAFLERALPPVPACVLEVGCGDGLVAASLASLGYAVTALDESLAIAEAAAAAPVEWVESNFLFYEGAEDGEPFDAVLFTRSLHHLFPLEQAIERAASLLRPDGRLVAEEFAFDRVNPPTASFFYSMEAILVAAGVLAPPDPALGAVRNPLGRWRQEHAHDPPIAGGHDMLAALRERFEVGPAEEAPYLYRYVHDRALAGGAGAAMADRLALAFFEIESRQIRERTIAAAGLRIVASLPAA